jgi:hypothetical protein
MQFTSLLVVLVSNMQTTVINLAGSPGSGKSTSAAGVFYYMKLKGINCELVTEFAKQLTWQERFNTLQNQPYVFSKQLDRLLNCIGKVDYVITDSPLFLSALYGETSSTFKAFVLESFNSFNNVNFYIERTKAYNPVGRNQTEAESDAIGAKIKDYMGENDINHWTINGDKEAVQKILDIISLPSIQKIQKTPKITKYRCPECKQLTDGKIHNGCDMVLGRRGWRQLGVYDG